MRLSVWGGEGGEFGETGVTTKEDSNKSGKVRVMMNSTFREVMVDESPMTEICIRASNIHFFLLDLRKNNTKQYKTRK